MRTELTDNPQRAAALVRRGHIVAFPTETVYGIGADAFNVAAVAGIFEAKARPRDNPLIVHVAELAQLDGVCSTLPRAAKELMGQFCPGPLTVIVNRSPGLPPEVTAGLDTVAVRMPSHVLAREFLAACRCPVAAPSANLSGRPSATTWEAVQTDLDGRIRAILCGEPPRHGIESTVVDCSDDIPVLLRPGAVTLEQLRVVVPGILDVTAAQGHTERSPGTRHRHYTPSAQVVVVRTPDECAAHPHHAFIGIAAPADLNAYGHTCLAKNEAEYARRLFDFFRQCEARGIKTIYCQALPGEGIGQALMDRLERSAAPQ